MFFLFDIFPFPLLLLWIVTIFIIHSTTTTTAIEILGVPPPLLRAGTHRHAFNPTLLGVLLGRRVLAGLGGALLFLRLLITLTLGLFLLLLRDGGGPGAPVIAGG